MEQFVTVNQQIAAVKKAKASHKQYIEDLRREVSEVQAEIHEIKNAPVREVEGKNVNEVLGMQADKLGFLAERETKLQNRREVAANIAAPAPYSVEEIVNEFTSATAKYTDEVVDPLIEEAIKAKEAYLAAIEAVDKAIEKHGVLRSAVENSLEFDMGKKRWIPFMGQKPSEIFVNKEHQDS